MKARGGYSDVALFRRLLAEARPYWRHIGLIFFISLLATPLALLTPVPLMIAVDSVLGSHPVPGFLDVLLPSAVTRSDTALLVVVAVMFVLIAVLTQAQSIATTVLQTYTGERLLLRFRSKLFQHVQRLSLAYHDRIGTADSTYRIQYDAMAVQYVAVQSTIALITAVSTLGGMIYVTAMIDPELALVVVAASPPILLVAKIFRPRMRVQSREVKKLESSALAVVQEVLTGLRVVKAFGQEDREHDRFLGRAGEGMRARIRLALVEGAYAMLIGVTIGAGGAAVLLVGMLRVQSGAITLGDLLLVMGYLTQLYAPLKSMAKNAGSLQNYLASAERTFGILDQAPEVPERTHAHSLARASGAVRFRDVSFAYEPNRPVLSDVTFEVEPGERLGIAGPTGAGKSTLMNLLTRFYDPDSGQILLDGLDLRDYKLADLRNQFGIVLQDPVLFSTSLAENIAYARPGASEAEIETAAKAANAHHFIVALPDGYATQVGERGMRLSGGERQRISLARAFLKDAPILILDEPTSSVDIKTEAVIMEAMERLMAGRTSFMIAHRVNTLDVCDRRLEIDRGRVVDGASAAPAIAGSAALNGGAGSRSRAAGRRTGEANRTGVEAHPAVKAWSRLRPGKEPRAVSALRTPKRGQRSSAYRLDGCGPEAAPVIAKRCGKASAEIENTVYRKVLPGLPIPALRYHGMIDEGGEWRWIFLEGAEGERYSPLIDEHRKLAARWLANVHCAASPSRQAPPLPDRGPGHYLAYLRSARRAISTHVFDVAYGSEESLVLGSLLRRLNLLESQWGEVAEFCDSFPRTLVHGDFIRKHLRIRRGGNRAELVAFEWDKAGWGVPAADLAQLTESQRSYVAISRGSKKFSGFSADPCLETYRSVVEPSTGLDRKSIELLAAVGNLFRCLAGLNWLGWRLAPDWTPLAELQVYLVWLTEAMATTSVDLRTGASPDGSTDSDEEALVRYLERDTLPRMRGKRSTIAQLERTGSPDATSYAAEILTAHLTNGEEIKLFLKDFGVSRAPKDGAEERRAREVHVYRDLLDGSDLGVPAYYGSVYDEKRARFWLLLELIPGTQLRSCDFDHWVDAARWLGRLQGYVAGHPRFQSSPLLIRHDRDYFGRKAELALVDAPQISTRAAHRLSKILADYDPLIDVMVEQPVTLVHGNYRPKNILLDLESEPVRVRAVDWEVAAVGATLYDLALLSDGYEPPRLEVLFDAYRAEAIERGAPVPDRRSMAYIADCFCLHRVIKALSRAREKGFSETQVSDLLDHGEQLHGRLRRRSRVSRR